MITINKYGHSVTK